jgi:hypothetical protein
MSRSDAKASTRLFRPRGIFYPPKLRTRLPTIMNQPSTRTKKMILKGSAMMIGGSIIIPIDIKTDATTMSMIRKGRNSKKADLEGALQLADHEGRNEDADRHLLAYLFVGDAGDVDEQLNILFTHVPHHEFAERRNALLECFELGDLLVDQRLDRLLVSLLHGRRHDE